MQKRFSHLHSEIGREAHLSSDAAPFPFAPQPCLRICASASGAPHRRQKFAPGGFIARQRTRRHRICPGIAVGYVLLTPVTRETPLQTPRMIVAISQTKNITHANAIMANIAKMWMPNCMIN
jgi:hypothetical protein